MCVLAFATISSSIVSTAFRDCSLCIRDTGRQTLLEEQGWEEIPVERIGVDGMGRGSPDQ